MESTLSLSTLKEADKLPLSELVKIGRAAGIIPSTVKSDEAACGIIMKAREIGIPPLAAFSSIHVINGVPSCSSQLMLACARRTLGDRLKYEVKDEPDQCIGRMSTDGGKTWNEVTYTMADAKRAGLSGRDNWRRHQSDMLRARVVSRLVRLCVPEATFGLYTNDEAQDIGPAAISDGNATPAQLVEAKLMPKEEAPAPEAPKDEPEKEPSGPANDDPYRIDAAHNTRAMAHIKKRGRTKEEAEAAIGRPIEEWTEADLGHLREWVKEPK